MLRSVIGPDAARPRSVPRATHRGGPRPLRRHGAVALDDPGTEHLDRRVLRRVDRQPAAAAQPVAGILGPRHGARLVAGLGQLHGEPALAFGRVVAEEDEDLLPHLGDRLTAPGVVLPASGEAQRERQKLGLQRIHRSTRIRARHPWTDGAACYGNSALIWLTTVCDTDDVPPRMKMRDGWRRWSSCSIAG